MVGVNPEVAHETMAGLSFHHGVGQALWAGKLFHIDLNGQRIGRYDQDFRFGAEDLKEAFLLVRLLERAGYDGPLHFDAHAYRNENVDGVWDFARRLHVDLPRAGREGRALRLAARGPGGARGRLDARARARERRRRRGRGAEGRGLGTSTPWPSAATTTSGWTNCSSTCSSACAEVDITARPAGLVGGPVEYGPGGERLHRTHAGPRRTPRVRGS